MIEFLLMWAKLFSTTLAMLALIGCSVYAGWSLFLIARDEFGEKVAGVVNALFVLFVVTGFISFMLLLEK